MAKRIQVGGRIESKEVGGIVTGAAEILDDAKGKKQSVINGETDDELVRLDQSKQDNLTFDNAPTEGSDNPVKSGGLYTAQQAILLAIAAINELIPSDASALNQLADKAFVNSSISTNTATFRGTSAAGLNEQQFLAWANGLEHDLNDYVFWQTSDAAGNTLFKRYKWNGTEWAYEYTLNNSTFTAEQWEAIQSGITALLVAKLRALPTAQELIQSFDSKQDVLTFDNVPTLGSTNPVKSSGIYNAIDDEKNRAEGAEQGLGEQIDELDRLIDDIQALIPAEATAQNQLADKADVAAKIVAAIPSWKGQYDVLTDLQAVTGAKAGDMGCVKTTDSDGHAVLTFYQYSAQGAWVVYYTLRHYAQNKPATTGTTGDYPYNGMGRIELQKIIVNGVNTLTQAMLTQQNTIYVIQYDFTLASDVTIPANCVLEFKGGSISGAYTLTGNNTQIKAQDVAIFKNGVIIAGSWNCPRIVSDWFGDITDDDRIRQLFNFCQDSVYNDVYIKPGNYNISAIEEGKTKVGELKVTSNTKINLEGAISVKANNLYGYSVFLLYLKKDITICGSGRIIGDKDSHIPSTTEPTNEWGFGINVLRCKNVVIDGLEISHFTGDGIFIDNDADTFRNNITNNIVIKNVLIHDCRRQGISIQHASCVTIEDFQIYNIKGTDPQYAIDIEPWWYVCENIIIRHGDIYNCIGGVQLSKYTLDSDDTLISNVEIEDVYFHTEDEDNYMLYNIFNLYRAERVRIKKINNDGKYSSHFAYLNNCIDVVFDECTIVGNGHFGFGSNPNNVLSGIVVKDSIINNAPCYASNIIFLNDIVYWRIISNGPNNQYPSNITVDGCTILGTICSCVVKGLFRFTNNICYNYDAGYYFFEVLSGSEKVQISNNKVFCNNHNFDIECDRLLFSDNVVYSVTGMYIIYRTLNYATIVNNTYYTTQGNMLSGKSGDTDESTASLLYHNNVYDSTMASANIKDIYPVPSWLANLFA